MFRFTHNQYNYSSIAQTLFSTTIGRNGSVASRTSPTSVLSMLSNPSLHHFHTKSSPLYNPRPKAPKQKVNPKKEEFRKKLRIESLLKQKRLQAKKLKMAKKRAGKRGKKFSGPKVVSPTLGKTPLKKGAPTRGPPIPKGAVYDGQPRIKLGWHYRKFVPKSVLFPQSRPSAFNPEAQKRLSEQLASTQNVDVSHLVIENGKPAGLVPLFAREELGDLSTYVSNFYSQLGTMLSELTAEESSTNAESVTASLESIVQFVHHFESTLFSLPKYVKHPKSRSEFIKYQSEFYETVPQIFSEHSAALVRILDTLEDGTAHDSLKYWLKRYGAYLSSTGGYSKYAAALKNLNKHFKDLEKKMDNVTFIALPQAYLFQLPRHVREQVKRFRTKFLGIDSYKLGAASHVVPTLEHVRDPAVRRDVFNQAREAVDSDRSKYYPLMQQSAQFMNKYAESLGFDSALDMQIEARYGLSTDNVRGALLDLSQNALNETYEKALLKSKKQENSVWKYNDANTTELVEYDRLHSEYTHFEEVMGVFSEFLPKSFLPLSSVLHTALQLAEQTFGVKIEYELARPGELWDDKHVKKFAVKENDQEDAEPLSYIYLDLFEREGKERDSGHVDSVDVLYGTPQHSAIPNSSSTSVVVNTILDENTTFPSTLSHKEASTLYRLIGEAVYEAIIVPRGEQRSARASNPLLRQTMGAYFARLLHNPDYLQKAVCTHVTKGPSPNLEIVKEMLLNDPIVKPIRLSEQANLSILDIDMFTQDTTLQSAIQSLEEQLSRGKIQPIYHLGQSMDTCGSQFVSVYAELLAAELSKRYPVTAGRGKSLNKELVDSLTGQLESADALKEEMNRVIAYDKFNTRLLKKYKLNSVGGSAPSTVSGRVQKPKKTGDKADSKVKEGRNSDRRSNTGDRRPRNDAAFKTSAPRRASQQQQV